MSLTKEDLQAIRQIMREEVAKAGKVPGRTLADLLKAQERKMEPLQVTVGDTLWTIKPEVVQPNPDDDFKPPLYDRIGPNENIPEEMKPVVQYLRERCPTCGGTQHITCPTCQPADSGEKLN